MLTLKLLVQRTQANPRGLKRQAMAEQTQSAYRLKKNRQATTKMFRRERE
jgi:hypothetical protein